MKPRTRFPAVAMLFAALALTAQPPAQADIFGSGANAFTIDFVYVGNAGNAADTTGYGSVPYEYFISTHEIPVDSIAKATAGGLSNVSTGPWTGSQPAGQMSWYEAAAFVNWLNTNSGYQAAYNLTSSFGWSMSLWDEADAWTLGGTNLYRHKNTRYFLPSENEWYKAAYYNPAGANYYLYPTASSTVPTNVPSGTNPGTAVFGQTGAQGPAAVTNAGGLSAYATMGQGGNLLEWLETAADGTNSSPSENRAMRGGDWRSLENELRSSNRFLFGLGPDSLADNTGLRVAAVPEPSTCALLFMTVAGAFYIWSRRRRLGER